MNRYPILALLVLVCLVFDFFGCSDSNTTFANGDSDGDLEPEADSQIPDGDQETVPDGDAEDGDRVDSDALDGDAADSDEEIYIAPDPDCTGCADFPGMYCVSEIRNSNCPGSLPPDPDMLYLIEDIHVEIVPVDWKDCGYAAWVRSGVANPPTFPIASFDDCHFRVVQLYGGPGSLDGPPPIPGSWNPETGDIFFGFDTCGYTFTKNACLNADGDGDAEIEEETETDTEAETETELEVEFDLETETEREESSKTLAE
jgi:hypothetical protein